MKIVGLTGGIASGKSTVSTILEDLGAAIIDVDNISRKVVNKGNKAYNDIVKNFGRDILLPNDEINRKALGSIVFADSEKLKLLNSITHSEIIKMVKIRIKELEIQEVKFAVIDAAILIEMGLHKLVDVIWLVIVDIDTQIKRLMDRDRFSYKEAINRINSQLSNGEKKQFANNIIDNNMPIEQVREYIQSLWDEL